MKLNDSKFTAALGKLTEISKAFTKADATNDAGNGFAIRIKTLTQQMTNTQGAVSTRSQGLRDSITRNEKQAARMEERVTQTQARLERQYSALDTSLTKLTGLNNYVTQQIANWNK